MAKKTNIYLNGKDLEEICEINSNNNIFNASFPPNTIKWNDGNENYKSYGNFGTGNFKSYVSGYIYSKEASHAGKTLSQAFGGLTASAKGWRPWNREAAILRTPGTYYLEKKADKSVMFNGAVICGSSMDINAFWIHGAGGGGGGSCGDIGLNGYGGGGGAGFIICVCFSVVQKWRIIIGAGGKGGIFGNSDSGLALRGEETSVSCDVNGWKTMIAGLGGGGAKESNNEGHHPGTVGTIWEWSPTTVDYGAWIGARRNGGRGGSKNNNGEGVPKTENAVYNPEGFSLFNYSAFSGGLVGAGTRGTGGGASMWADGGSGGGANDIRHGKNGKDGSGGGGGGDFWLGSNGGNGGSGWIRVYY